MQWQDEGIIIGTRKHGETSLIVEAMTAQHGRHLGLVRGGRSRRRQPVLQPGNRVELTWRARLDEHLGTFQADPIALNAARLFDSPVAIYGLQLLAAHLRMLPERDPHGHLYEATGQIIDHLEDALTAAELLAQFELLMLEELGFGLELTSCAATGSTRDLIYVSPKSGRAVSRDAGAQWSDKLLRLPDFLHSDEQDRPSPTVIKDAFSLTGFFFTRHLWEPRGTGEPEARPGFLAAVARALQSES